MICFGGVAQNIACEPQMIKDWCNFQASQLPQQLYQKIKKQRFHWSITSHHAAENLMAGANDPKYNSVKYKLHTGYIEL